MGNVVSFPCTWHEICFFLGMNDTLSMILTWVSPLIAWLPLSGRDRRGEPSVAGRAEFYLMLGAAAAVPAGLLRFIHFSESVNLSYETAYTFFNSLILDGFSGTLLPFAALIVSVGINGKPRNGRSASGRASLVILAYCLVDGVFAYHSRPGFSALVESLIRSAPKLAMAPVWGLLMAEDNAPGNHILLLIPVLIIGSVFSGLVSFMSDIGLVPAASAVSLFLFLGALGLQYRVLEGSQFSASH